MIEVKGGLSIIVVVGFLIAVLLPLYTVYFIFLFYYAAYSPAPLFILTLPVVLLLLYVLYTALLIVEAKITMFLLKPLKKEGSFKMDKISKPLIFWSVSGTLIGVIISLLDKMLLPKATTAGIVFNLFGAKIGKGCFLAAPIVDPYLVEIGDNVMIGQDSIVSGHLIENGVLHLAKVKIGNNATVGAHSIVSPGAVIEDNVIVGAHSFVKKNDRLKKNSLYVGCPACFKKKI